MALKRRDFLLSGSSMIAVSAVDLTASSDRVSAQAPNAPIQWKHEADVVIGSGATGLPAAIVARETGASVIIVEAEKDVGGHAITSGGNVPMGGGTSVQKKYGIQDSPDLLFQDLTDWSVVEPNGFRITDTTTARSFVPSPKQPSHIRMAPRSRCRLRRQSARSDRSIGRQLGAAGIAHAAVMDWPMVQTGKPVDPMLQRKLSSGNGLMRPLEAAAKKDGVRILLEHKMTAIFRETPTSGRVFGIAAENKGTKLNIAAHKAVIITTGGSTGNVNFRRMFDPRLTEEYCGLARMPWSNQDASGEIAGMAIGASLWGLYNQTGEFALNLNKPGSVGSQYGNAYLRWMPGSPVFDRARASGLPVANGQNVILVNMLGKRFYDETGGQFAANDYNSIHPYVRGSYLNAKNAKFNPNNIINAALTGIGDDHNGGGPIWAIFDADAVTSEKWIRRRRTSISRLDSSSPPKALAISRRRSKCNTSAFQCHPITSSRPSPGTTHLSIRERTTISASRNRSTRSPIRRSTPHGRHRSCTTPVSACGSTLSVRSWT
jgi:hypothetical protein